MNWYLGVLKKYAVFSGRARRKEYWMFILFNVIVLIVLGLIDSGIGSGGVLGILYGLATLIPSLAVAVRRLHDTNRGGWWLLTAIVPVIGTPRVHDSGQSGGQKPAWPESQSSYCIVAQ